MSDPEPLDPEEAAEFFREDNDKQDSTPNKDAKPLFPCSSCSDLMSANADKCPNCGNPNELTEKKSESSPYFFSLGFRTFGVFIIAFWAIGLSLELLSGFTDFSLIRSGGGCIMLFLPAICAMFYYYTHKSSDEQPAPVALSKRKSGFILCIVVLLLIYYFSFNPEQKQRNEPLSHLQETKLNVNELQENIKNTDMNKLRKELKKTQKGNVGEQEERIKDIAKESKEENTSEERSGEREGINKTEYVMKVLRIRKNIKETVTRLVKMGERFHDNQKLMKKSSYRRKFIRIANDLEQKASSWNEQQEYPEGYNEYHETLSKSLNNFEQAGMTYAKGMEKLDGETIRRGTDFLKKGARMWREAQEKAIDRLQEKHPDLFDSSNQ